MDVLEHRCDVLVVGGGISAVFAALNARESGLDVLLVDKGFFGRSGCSALASGVQQVFVPDEDDLDAWVAAWGGPLVNLRLTRKAVQETYEVYRRMDEYGVKWIKHEGKLVRVMSGGAGSRSVLVGMFGEGGPQMMMAMRSAAVQHGVRVVNRVMVSDLLTSDGCQPTSGSVLGAVGMDCVTGRPHVFRSKAVVMCAGPFRFPFATSPGLGFQGMPVDAGPNGLAMMLRVGAKLGKLEFGGYGPAPHDFFCAPGLEIIGGLGGKFIDRNGNDILANETITKDASFIARRSSLSLAIARHIGRGDPVYLDCRHFTLDMFRLLRSVIPIVVGNFELGGYDLATAPVPYLSILACSSGVSGGGAAIDEHGATSIDGLFAAGNNSDGAYISMAQQLHGSAVLGCWAGTGSAKYVREVSIQDDIRPHQVERLIGALISRLRAGSEDYSRLHGCVQQVLTSTVGRVYNDSALSSARNQLLDLLPAVSECQARDMHELVKVLSLENFCQSLDVVLQVMLWRKESRGNIVKTDYPYTDNDRWLCYTRAQLNTSGELRIWDEPRPETEDYLAVERTREMHAFFKEGQG